MTMRATQTRAHVGGGGRRRHLVVDGHRWSPDDVLHVHERGYNSSTGTTTSVVL
jgi:hypothetical protein